MEVDAEMQKEHFIRSSFIKQVQELQKKSAKNKNNIIVIQSESMFDE